MFIQSALISETPRLRKFALRLTRNSSDANDLLQSTCLRALEKSNLFEDGTNLFSWTSKIMFNIFVSGYRRKSKFETQLDPDIYLDKETVSPLQETILEISNVEKAMLKLSYDHRRVLFLICVNGMCYLEASKILKISLGTVRSRLSRAREQLKVIMDTPRPISMPVMPISVPRLSSNRNTPFVPAYIAAHAMQRTTYR